MGFKTNIQNFYCFLKYCILQPKNCKTVKSVAYIISLFFLLFACKKDDSIVDNNPYFDDNVLVNFTIDLTLPQYNTLNFPGNHLVLNNIGIRGVVVYNVDNSTYHAFELSDPNHFPSDCSKMEVEGIHATCTCSNEGDNPNQYDIITGQHMSSPGSTYPMFRYRAQRNGNTLKISNN